MATSRSIGRAVAGGLALAAAGWALKDVPAELGGRAAGERLERMRRSPQFRDGVFRNATPGAEAPSPQSARELVWNMFLNRGQRRPAARIPVVASPSGGPSPDGLSVIWYGHATALLEIEGRRVLLDPVWSRRASPSQLVGPRRLHPLPGPLAGLPPLDAVVISHDHYDHLDRATVRALTALQTAPFLVPLGIGAHLERWGVPASRIVELDWEEETTVAGLRFAATAARHFSGRTLNRNVTLWGSWVIAGRAKRVFYAGDSGYFDGYAGIGAAYGPFDLTLLPIGAYSPAWPDIHMTPEEAVTAHLDLGGRLMLPVHWATFTLAAHPWAEPVDRLWREAKARDVRLAVPRPGERVDTGDVPMLESWWEMLHDGGFPRRTR
ncbi:L-ascorbate metabolism protein UlaG (beta-lactamase superfamily) [Streptosporangium becharense]|uniref:L-ascorbate metabolism protein UlaG (Beta-lactamase superfamily) n=1 Tax=Streptosporangium becharense TaxID=1816182 RepID=A0A7W9IC50_9ACTN|nr:MBL fold metallo-hydrolase [Streptosporangium becharense]MBB2913615.1 L-ascorbate metabolism protein UlaG (beta-lactamase superfamily) [Streptosporangium becharense]MBB5817696.1 L-ascorbate metabolism protein UlaG (beta-lactamase superfamily) [Streptosporangium becharense]